MDIIRKLVLSPLQTLGTTEPIPLVGIYDATPFGSKERIGTNYLVGSAYGDTVRIKISENEQAITKKIFDDYKWAEITPLVTFKGLTGRISTSKKGVPIICGTAEAVTLVTPPPPSVRESLARLFEGSTGGEL